MCVCVWTTSCALARQTTNNVIVYYSRHQPLCHHSRRHLYSFWLLSAFLVCFVISFSLLYSLSLSYTLAHTYCTYIHKFAKWISTDFCLHWNHHSLPQSLCNRFRARTLSSHFVATRCILSQSTRAAVRLHEYFWYLGQLRMHQLLLLLLLRVYCCFCYAFVVVFVRFYCCCYCAYILVVAAVTGIHLGKIACIYIPICIHFCITHFGIRTIVTACYYLSVNCDTYTYINIILYFLCFSVIIASSNAIIAFMHCSYLWAIKCVCMYIPTYVFVWFILSIIRSALRLFPFSPIWSLLISQCCFLLLFSAVCLSLAVIATCFACHYCSLLVFKNKSL